jgi:hypothetical protein
MARSVPQRAPSRASAHFTEIRKSWHVPAHFLADVEDGDVVDIPLDGPHVPEHRIVGDAVEPAGAVVGVAVQYGPFAAADVPDDVDMFAPLDVPERRERRVQTGRFRFGALALLPPDVPTVALAAPSEKALRAAMGRLLKAPRR